MIIEPVPPHCSRCCPTNPMPDTDVKPPRPAETYEQACRDEEPLLGLDATRWLPTLCVLPKGHDGDHDNGAGTTWRYDPNPAAPTVAVHRTRPSSYAAGAQESQVREARVAGYADGYYAALQDAREKVREAAEKALTDLLDAAPPLHPQEG